MTTVGGMSAFMDTPKCRHHAALFVIGGFLLCPAGFSVAYALGMPVAVDRMIGGAMGCATIGAIVASFFAWRSSDFSREEERAVWRWSMGIVALVVVACYALTRWVA